MQPGQPSHSSEFSQPSLDGTEKFQSGLDRLDELTYIATEAAASSGRPDQSPNRVSEHGRSVIDATRANRALMTERPTIDKYDTTQARIEGRNLRLFRQKALNPDIDESILVAALNNDFPINQFVTPAIETASRPTNPPVLDESNPNYSMGYEGDYNRAA